MTELLTNYPTSQEQEDAALRLRNAQLEMASRAIERGRPIEVDEHWEARALCVQTGPDAFYPEKGITSRDAKKICTRCRVITQCLEAALARNPDDDFGVWGGTTEHERRQMRKDRQELTRAS